MLTAPLILPRCDEVADHVSEFLDGELDERARQRVRLHLALCGGCARLAADLGVVVAALHRLARRGGTVETLRGTVVAGAVGRTAASARSRAVRSVTPADT